MSKQNDAVNREPSERKGRVRTCVGCGERVDVSNVRGTPALVRLILGPGGVLAVDPGDGGFGRGAHVHPRRECLAAAVSRGLARAAKGRVHAIHVDAGAPVADAAEAPGVEPLTAVSLALSIQQAMDRRIQGLVRAAVRSQHVAIGADAVQGACVRGEAALVLVACDAAAGVDLAEVRRAVAEGRAAAWGSKQVLGALAGGLREQGVAVLAITEERIAAAISDAVHVADACAAVQREGTQAGGRAASGRKRRPEQPARGRDAEASRAGAAQATPEDVGARRQGESSAMTQVALGASTQAASEAHIGAAAAAGRSGGATPGRKERMAHRGGAGRLLAPAPETRDSGAVGGMGAAPGSSGRSLAVDRVAANRRPRGWVRRIG